MTLNTHGRRVFINIKGSSTAATVINILDSGTVSNFPKITNLTAKEDESGIPIVFNLPNASAVNIDSISTPVFGHVIAPNHLFRHPQDLLQLKLSTVKLRLQIRYLILI